MIHPAAHIIYPDFTSHGHPLCTTIQHDYQGFIKYFNDSITLDQHTFIADKPLATTHVPLLCPLNFSSFFSSSSSSFGFTS